MNKTARTITTTAALLLGLGVAGGAAAQSTWDLSTNACDPNGLNPGQAGCAVGGVNATVTAWGGGSATNFVQARITDQTTSGVGAASKVGSTTETTGYGHHAIDNSGGSGSLGASTELVMVQFSQAMKLTGLSIGWYQTDADISVLRWAGSGAPTLSGSNTSNLVSSSTTQGWQLVSSADVDPSYSWNFDGGAYSSWWLISSYFGATVGSSWENDSNSGGSKLAAGNDYFKLLSFSAQPGGSSPPQGVPEPGSLLLAGLALTGLVAAQRRGSRRR